MAVMTRRLLLGGGAIAALGGCGALPDTFTGSANQPADTSLLSVKVPKSTEVLPVLGSGAAVADFDRETNRLLKSGNAITASLTVKGPDGRIIPNPTDLKDTTSVPVNSAQAAFAAIGKSLAPQVPNSIAILDMGDGTMVAGVREKGRITIQIKVGLKGAASQLGRSLGEKWDSITGSRPAGQPAPAPTPAPR